MTSRPDCERPGDEASPRVCWCMTVHEATLIRAIRAGAVTPEALRAATRAGMGCGTCRIDLQRLLERALAAEARRRGA